MRLPEKIEVKITAAGQPVAGLLVDARIVTTRKNNFVLLFGPTDENGELTITREDLLRQAEQDRQFFIMDYGDPEGDFSGNLLISIFGREHITRALKAYPLFKDVASFPIDYLKNITQAERILVTLHPTKLSLEVKHEGVGPTVRIGSEDY